LAQSQTEAFDPDFWQHIALEMTQKGFNRSAEECQAKWFQVRVRIRIRIRVRARIGLGLGLGLGNDLKGYQPLGRGLSSLMVSGN
jgi:hypothetical protein